VEKTRLALDFATGLAVQAKLPSKLTCYLENLIKARLGRSRG
jgi:hypothetical protein